mmetsp:Transcript_16173/g.27367  ORF Transcript_16173/g.27367 Transcript_16173/m.27367 type:complete len:173 (-) Transcript_16173:108-626(-)
MRALKRFSKSKKNDLKVIVLFNSVSDSLFNNENPLQGGEGAVSRGEFERFLIELTLSFEFDFLELYSPIEIIEFLREVHLSIKDKPHRKELSMYSRKGFKPSKKAMFVGGFTDSLSVLYVSWLMCVPGVSENKAISLAKVFPTLRELMNHLEDKGLSEKERKEKIQEVEVVN